MNNTIERVKKFAVPIALCFGLGTTAVARNAYGETLPPLNKVTSEIEHNRNAKDIGRKVIENFRVPGEEAKVIVRSSKESHGKPVAADTDQLYIRVMSLSSGEPRTEAVPLVTFKLDERSASTNGSWSGYENYTTGEMHQVHKTSTSNATFEELEDRAVTVVNDLSHHEPIYVSNNGEIVTAGVNPPLH